jgi:hypothetical protein
MTRVGRRFGRYFILCVRFTVPVAYRRKIKGRKRLKSTCMVGENKLSTTRGESIDSRPKWSITDGTL